MLDEGEWTWLDAQLTGDVDHLLVATSLPLLLLPAIHHAEAWNEAVCAGAWGARAAQLGERIRRSLDLKHWAAFRSSFARLIAMLASVAAGERGRPPATIVVLSGDVHHTYLAEAGLHHPGGTRVYQAVCSPFRNPLGWAQRVGFRLATTRGFTTLLARLAASAGVPPPPIGWKLTHGPFFHNGVAFLELDGRSATLTLERPRVAPPGSATLA